MKFYWKPGETPQKPGETPQKPPPPSGGNIWRGIAAGGKFQIMARRELGFHWFNTLWQWSTNAIPDSGKLAWKKVDPIGGVVTHVEVTLTEGSMQFRIYRMDDKEVVEDNQYLVSAREVAEALRVHDTSWYNGIVIYAGFYLDVIIRLA